jgi:methyl-accepting chemotaxis protein
MNNYSEQISKALLAHGAWKQRLNSAVVARSSEFTPAQVGLDNRCDFGRWFYSLPAELRATEIAGKVQKLHAEFHGEAARVLSLALQGEKDQALKALGFGEKYSLVSGQLAMALKQWEKLIAAG